MSLLLLFATAAAPGTAPVVDLPTTLTFEDRATGLAFEDRATTLEIDG